MVTLCQKSPKDSGKEPHVRHLLLPPLARKQLVCGFGRAAAPWLALVNKSACIWNFDFFPFFGKECCLHFFVLGVNESAYISIQKGDCLHFDFLFLSVNNTAYIWNFDFLFFSVKNIAYIFVLWGKWKCLHFHPKRRLPTFQFFVSVGKQYCLHFHFCFFCEKESAYILVCLVFCSFLVKENAYISISVYWKKNDDCFRFRFWVVVNDTAGLFLVQDNLIQSRAWLW